jgi:hypothetical protein
MNGPSRRSYPLGALFILVAFCGVLAALAAPLARAISSGAISASDVAIAMGAGALLAALLGAVVGAHHVRWLVGSAIGLGAGALIGAVCGPLVLIPARGFPALLFAGISGSIVLVAAAAALRWGSGR